MPRDKNKVEHALLKKGFQRREGDHHFFVYFTLDGKKTTVYTKTSHTPKMKDINDGLLAQMSKQCRLQREAFLGLVDCNLTQEDYEQWLIKQEII